MELLSIVRDKLGKSYDDLEFLLVCLKEVLRESGEQELAVDIPWIHRIRTFKVKLSQGSSFIFFRFVFNC